MSEYRKPKHLSPSSRALWEREQDEFFYRYICPKDIRPDKPPQTDPMSVGSAFDALVKAELYEHFYGREKTLADGYNRTKLVVEQCEEHTLPESLVIAVDCFEQYVECGAYGNLRDFITLSPEQPRMEFQLVKTIGGVPMLGKPDLHFHTSGGCHVITDWKVSGACSNHGVSPQQGYQIALSANGGRGLGEPHKRYQPSVRCGTPVNGVPMNETTDYWAEQLATYAWALGEKVGTDEFIARIEQLACRPCPKTDDSGRLRIKCVVHQSTIDPDYQVELLERYQKCWHHVSTGHYFSELSKSESDAHANHLIRQMKDPVILPPDLSQNDIPVINFGGKS